MSRSKKSRPACKTPPALTKDGKSFYMTANYVTVGDGFDLEAALAAEMELRELREDAGDDDNAEGRPLDDFGVRTGDSDTSLTMSGPAEGVTASVLLEYEAEGDQDEDSINRDTEEQVGDVKVYLTDSQHRNARRK